MGRDYRTRQNGPKRSRGRPKKYWRSVRYTDATARKIIEQLGEGAAWSRICGKDGMPSYATLYDWSARWPEFGRAVAQARAMAADVRAEKALEIAENATVATVQRDRLEVSTLMQHAARMAPRRWGGRAVDDELEEPPEPYRIRRFKRVVLEDGRRLVVEVFPGDEEDMS